MSCEMCEKNFDSMQNLKIHIKIIHEGLKKYECDICGKSFSRFRSGSFNKTPSKTPFNTHFSVLEGGNFK